MLDSEKVQLEGLRGKIGGGAGLISSSSVSLSVCVCVCPRPLCLLMTKLCSQNYLGAEKFVGGGEKPKASTTFQYFLGPNSYCIQSPSSSTGISLKSNVIYKKLIVPSCQFSNIGQISPCDSSTTFLDLAISSFVIFLV